MTDERRTEDRTGYPPPALTAVVLGIMAVVLAVVAIVMVAETSTRAFASFTPLRASVVDEHFEAQVVADRRGNRTDRVRVVTVELPDGALAELRSEDLAVGATATVSCSVSSSTTVAWSGVYDANARVVVSVIIATATTASTTAMIPSTAAVTAGGGYPARSSFHRSSVIEMRPPGHSRRRPRNGVIRRRPRRYFNWPRISPAGLFALCTLT